MGRKKQQQRQDQDQNQDPSRRATDADTGMSASSSAPESPSASTGTSSSEVRTGTGTKGTREKAGSPSIPVVDSSPAKSKSGSPSVVNSSPTKSKAGKKVQDPTPSLTISRNKHTRYISAFHGPWLQLPHEILETLAHSNFLSPRPRQTDPGVLYDLIKIRKLVDEASDLAVRAQNGTASSALSNDNGLPGGAFGLSYRGASGHAKLSPERKYRMREMATHKLAEAYRLDEVAASVATMQGASALDSVASLVLQRNANNADAKYVHYFHEKIPSRMMSESTPLQPLNEIIAAQPGHAPPFRTRALMKIFKEDHAGAAQDLTEALALCRLQMAKHKAGRNQLVTMKTAREEAEKRKVWTRDWMNENRVIEEDQPKGLEMQLLFQRGNQYLTIACRHIKTALQYFKRAQKERASVDPETNGDTAKEANPHGTAAGTEAYKRALEARETIRKNAKRALRDYTTFLSRLDYAHAPRHAANEDIFSRDSIPDDLEEFEASGGGRPHSQALVRSSREERDNHRRRDISPPPDLTIYEMSALLSSSAPPDLPPFPNTASASPSATEHDETLTYHPLLPEALHSFLLTHCLLQTPPTALLRHAYNVARLVRLADGYPFFLAARSPARADWCEILRKTGNWIGLRGTQPPAGARSADARTDGAAPTNGTADAMQGAPRTRSRHYGSGSAGWEDLILHRSSPESPTEQQHVQQQRPAGEAERIAGPDAVNGHALKSPKNDAATEPQAPGTNGSASDAPPAVHTNGAMQRQPTESASAKRTRIHKEAVMDALGDERVVDDETFARAVAARERRAWKESLCLELGDSGDGEEAGEPAGANGVGSGVTGDKARAPRPKHQQQPALQTNGTAPAPVPTADTARPQSRHAPGTPLESGPRPHGTAPSATLTPSHPTTPLSPNPNPNPSHSRSTEPPMRATPIQPAKATAPPAGHRAKEPTPRDEEYLIGTERAECVAVWILEAPAQVVGGERRRRKGGRRRRGGGGGVVREVEEVEEEEEEEDEEVEEGEGDG